MDLRGFENWLRRLSPDDRHYLEKNGEWRKAYDRVQRDHVLPPGFVEMTMVLLEGGSESET
jgi:hypothetical protein